jgi:hypothetical protein
MARTKQELDQAAADAEKWIDSIGPEDLGRVPDDLASVTAAATAANLAKSELEEAVLEARKQGRSWGRIGLHLGVSRQAALQRFGKLEAERAAGATS